MKGIKIDKYGDIVVEQGQTFLTNAQEDIIQSIYIILNINKDEWFLNTNLGLNYNTLIKHRVSKMEIENALREAISQDDRIKQVMFTHIDLNNVTRELEIVGYVTDKDDNKISFQEVLGIED